MTQKFKFGNSVLVSREDYQKVGVVVKVYDKQRYLVAMEGDYYLLLDDSELELIPHPDTARLDWIESQQGFKESILKLSDGSHADFSIRELIDKAMQQEQTK